MNNDPSRSTNQAVDIGSDPAGWADGTGSEGRDLPSSSRGLLGRLFGALSGAGEAEHTDADVHRAPAPVFPGMVNLRRLRVDDVAIPKVEIVAASDTADLNDLVEMFREHGFSRIPVFRGNLDSPVGLILLKDLALKYGFGPKSSEKFIMSQLLRPLLYVPPSMPIGVLLQQMQKDRIHMALVIDEYGGVDGLVTIEDLIEQVIGEIEDEHDEVEGGLWMIEKPGQWLVQARAPLDELEQETGLRLAPGEEDEDIDTLGGLIFTLAGRVPVRGEVIPHDSGAEFEIIDADPRRVKRVRLRLASSKGDMRIIHDLPPKPDLEGPDRPRPV